MDKKSFKVRDLRVKEKFYIDDDYLNGWARLLKPTATAVYLSLCRHADKKQSCFPSMDLIAEQHSISRKTVQRAINKLRKFNLIKTEQKRNKKGTWLQNVYYLLNKTEWKKTVGQNDYTVDRGSKKSSTEGQKRPTTEGQTRPIKVTHKKKVTHYKERYSSLSALKDFDFQEIAEKYNVPIAFVRSKFEDLENYCGAFGRRYKNYRLALMNFVKKDALKIKQDFSNANNKRAIDASNI